MDKGKFYEQMKNCYFQQSAWKKLHELDKAVQSYEGLEDQCQAIFNILDEVVFDKYESQFQQKLITGKTLYRARIIKPEDEDDETSGIGRNEENIYTGYNEIGSREPLIGISGAGRNNISGMSY